MSKTIESWIFKDLVSCLFPDMPILDYGAEELPTKNYSINVEDTINKNFCPQGIVLKVDYSK